MNPQALLKIPAQVSFGGPSNGNGGRDSKDWAGWNCQNTTATLNARAV